MKKKNVIITGVAGFIGSNLADRLIKEDKYNVIGIDDLSYGLKEQIPDDVNFLQLDIRGKNLGPIFKNVDYVFHFAAKNCISDCQKDPKETFDINVNGTINIYEGCKKYGVKKIIYAESSAMYEGSNIYPTPETELKPQSFYAISKATSMFIADSYYKLHNVKSTALRYFCVYGPRQDYRRSIPPLFSSVIIKLLRGEQPTIYGTGEKRRDFIYVDDINDFHIQCMEDERTTGNVYNLGSGQNYSVNEIYYTIANLLGSDIKPKYEADLPGEALQNLADITQAKILGWYPRISLENGLKSSIEFIKNEIQKGHV
jgi:UDP-glucose 4-epimerase